MTRFVPVRRVWLFAVVALGGCQTPPAVDPRPATAVAVVAPPAAVPPTAAAPRPTLLDEQRRLSALFQGTPVVFAMQSGGVLRVDVPLRFCFDRGQTAIKPALAAVVDRLAQSQRDATSRLQLSAVGDALPKPSPGAAAASGTARSAAAGARAALGTRRAAGVRDRLVAQGIAADRIALEGGDPPGVRLTISEPAAP